MKNFLIAIVLIVCVWVYFQQPKAHWEGWLADDNPTQSSDHLPAPWEYKDCIITPRAQYHIRAVILSKHHYWSPFAMEDKLSSYDLALGWEAMSDAKNINRLYITQGGRWYHYRWSGNPPIDVTEMMTHSSNHHIIAADHNVLDAVANFRRFDLVDLDGYLVDIQSVDKNWYWHTSLSRFETGDGACKVFWVKSAYNVS